MKKVPVRSGFFVMGSGDNLPGRAVDVDDACGREGEMQFVLVCVNENERPYTRVRKQFVFEPHASMLQFMIVLKKLTCCLNLLKLRQVVIMANMNDLNA